MTKKTIFSIFVIFGIALLFAPQSFAQATDEISPTPNVEINPRLKEAKERMEKTKTKLSEIKESVKQNLTNNICEIATGRVDQKLANYEAIKSDEFPRVTKIVSALKERSSALKEKGFDTTKLNADIATLDTKASTAKAKYETFISKLKETKNYACGSSQGNFRAALQTAKQSHKEAIVALRDTRQFIRLTIISDLRALRNSKELKLPPLGITSTPTTQ